MEREKQLKYCKKCIHQEFNMQQGLLCGLTKEKANFVGECEHFELDKSKVEKVENTNNGESKSKIAFGFSPKQLSEIATPELTKKQALVVAYEAAKRLKWDIGFLSDSGFIAFTKISMISWSEEVQVKIEVGQISIKSECSGSQWMDWGKNKKNIELFTSTFAKIQSEISELDLDQKYQEIAIEFNESEDEHGSPLSKKETITGFFSLLKPTEGYFITPLLVNINILIFILMIISGVHFLSPTGDSLLEWGANFRPSTLDGEWWRLITCTFLHIGIFHLLMNMYALIYIGLLLEPYLGRTRFLSAYLLTGIAGSAISLTWHELTISAGASGAIFGMYGLFISMLTTNLIEKSARKTLLTSIAIFVTYNLLNGLNDGIDNAAHIGGLVSGILIGFAFYPSLKKPSTKIKVISIALMTLFIGVNSYWILENTSSDIVKYDQDMVAFSVLEEKALGLYSLHQSASDEIYLEEIETNGIPSWEEALKILENTEMYDLPDFIHDRSEKLKEYCNLRIKSYKLTYKFIKEDTDEYTEELDQINIEITRIIDELSTTE